MCLLQDAVVNLKALNQQEHSKDIKHAQESHKAACSLADGALRKEVKAAIAALGLKRNLNHACKTGN